MVHDVVSHPMHDHRAGFYMPGLRGQPLQARSGLVYEFGGRMIAEPYGGLCRPASADGQEGPSPTQAASSPPSTSTSASLLRYMYAHLTTTECPTIDPHLLPTRPFSPCHACSYAPSLPLPPPLVLHPDSPPLPPPAAT
jgi:hypothetical protein